MTNLEKEITFDSIRGKKVEDIPSNFHRISCFGDNRPSWSAYRTHNVKTGNTWKTNRSYYSKTVPTFNYLMDGIGQRWLSYTLYRYGITRSVKNINLRILIPSNKRIQKDLENNRVAPYSFFFHGGIFLAEYDYDLKIRRLKVIDVANLPKKLLPEPNKTVEEIAQDEIQTLADLIDLQTGGKLTYDYICRHSPAILGFSEKIGLVKPKYNGEVITTDWSQHGFGVEYNVKTNSIYLGYKDGQPLPTLKF